MKKNNMGGAMKRCAEVVLLVNQIKKDDEIETVKKTIPFMS